MADGRREPGQQHAWAWLGGLAQSSSRSQTGPGLSAEQESLLFYFFSHFSPNQAAERGPLGVSRVAQRTGRRSRGVLLGQKFSVPSARSSFLTKKNEYPAEIKY